MQSEVDKMHFHNGRYDPMPPKVKIPREAIIDKAFELTKAYGFEKKN